MDKDARGLALLLTVDWGAVRHVTWRVRAQSAQGHS